MNLMVLGGLVVALRALDRRRRAPRFCDPAFTRRTVPRVPESTAIAIREGLAEAHRPFTYAALIVLVGSAAAFLLERRSPAPSFRRWLSPMALRSWRLACIAATLAPAVAMMLYPAEPRQHQSSRFALWLRQRYERALAWVLAEPLPVIAAAAILTLVGVGLLTQVSQPSLLPGVKERNLLVRWDGPSGTSHPEMVRMVSRAANEIKAIPGVSGCRLARRPRNHFRPGRGNQFRRDLDQHRS